MKTVKDIWDKACLVKLLRGKIILSTGPVLKNQINHADIDNEASKSFSRKNLVKSKFGLCHLSDTGLDKFLLGFLSVRKTKEGRCVKYVASDSRLAIPAA